MTEELAPARLSLWDIESAWLELIQGRQEAEAIENPAERESALAACDQAIAEFTAREVDKADGIRAVCRALKSVIATAKEEGDYQAKRAASAEALLDHIKASAQTAMEATGKRRIDGRTGYLLLKKNGGVQPLEITEEAMLPDELRLVTVTFRGDAYVRLWPYMPLPGVLALPITKEVRPDNAAIRAALQEPCPSCGGHPELIVRMKPDDPEGCAACGGSGRNAVPGARLLERAHHVEIR